MSCNTDGFRRELLDQKGRTHSLSESGSIVEVSAPSARMDNPTGRLAEMDFSSKETAIPRLEDKISNAIFPDGQKLLLASNTPDAPAQNQVSGSHSELASSSGGVTKHAPVEMVGWTGTINRNDSSTFTFESDELCAPGQWTTLDERIVDDRKVWIIVVDNFLIWMFGTLQIKGKVTCYRRLSTPCHRSGLWIDRIRDFWLIGVGVLNSRKQTRQLVHGSMS